MKKKRYSLPVAAALLAIGAVTSGGTAFAQPEPSPDTASPGYVVHEKSPNKEDYWTCFSGRLCFDWNSDKHIEFFRCGVFPVSGWTGNIEQVFNNQVGGRGFAVWYDQNMNHIGVLNNGKIRQNVSANPIYYVSPC
ncbi:hypothetical protein OG474_42945 [Kribbella sp. NBC_01505]|uniref:hypothetical protein n=1 Tax=Kribbella sp. NBC_01505 TaxID=2903580 RepID=UPI003865A140